MARCGRNCGRGCATGGDDVARALELLEAWGARGGVLVTLCCWDRDARELGEHNYNGFVELRYTLDNSCVELSVIVVRRGFMETTAC